jgi:hypothetical protein
VEFGGKLRLTGGAAEDGGNEEDREVTVGGGKDSFWSLGIRRSEISTFAVGLRTNLIEHLCADGRPLSIKVASASSCRGLLNIFLSLG